MSRVLLLGVSPLPTEHELKHYAPGLRTWQFAQALVEGGHEVTLVCSRTPYVYEGLPPISQALDGHLGIPRYDIDEATFVTGNFVAELAAGLSLDCVVGVNAFPSAMAMKLPSGLPIWADMNGHLMAEAQVKAFVYKSDYYLQHFWAWERAILDQADVLSVISWPQYYATLGELGTRGRLNQYTVGYDFVRRIPDAYPPRPVDGPIVEVRGGLVPENAFVALWTGGYNTWTDIVTLFRGLEMAMAEVPDLYFVSAGGMIRGHDEITYPSFLQMIGESRFKHRFVMLGWRPGGEVPAYQEAADVAVMIDGKNVEAELGTRTRMMAWAEAKLPIVSTAICEFARELQSLGLLYDFAAGDPAGLASALVKAARDGGERRRRAAAAAEFVSREYHWLPATAPLVAWCRDPRRAPDYGYPRALTHRDPMTHAAYVISELRMHWRSRGLIGVAGRCSHFLRNRASRLRRKL